MAANASLAALYRPQTFAEVVGQDMVKSILSRAAREDRVAPAYLLSGTRGVGKTTIARIFAKALNCEHAPTGEPCNQCDACRRITQGNFVDVVEIDGASNRGIDDIRRLRDAVGYAPLEGRYKVFIIDEAHMLTKEAFNALLKTLEEPPARVTFILATTEQHKFPVTIISRCQHFVFRQIPESTLETHICSILQKEGRTFEQEAAHLIARRASGSVRDAMSLLGQVLALGCTSHEPLTAQQTREVLGLAGREVMDSILQALAEQNSSNIAALVQELLAQGADMGFFLRELGNLWRNLFLIKQAGKDAANDLDMPASERNYLIDMASRFTLTYIHAAWQMTLDAQKRILTSLEPSAGLELLLLNLAMLPRLLPLEEWGLPSADASRADFAKETKNLSPSSAILISQSTVQSETFPSPRQNIKKDNTENRPSELLRKKDNTESHTNVMPQGSTSSVIQQTTKPNTVAASPRPPRQNSALFPAPAQSTDEDWKNLPIDSVLIWEKFLAWCSTQQELPLPMLRQVHGEVRGDWLILRPLSQVIGQQLQKQDNLRTLERIAESWAGKTLKIVFQAQQNTVLTEAEIKKSLSQNDTIKKFQEAYDAVLVHCVPIGSEQS
jgi:DNA polymerase-3 subunit gamma/tau